jgi:biotin transport system substrate-specific component
MGTGFAGRNAVVQEQWIRWDRFWQKLTEHREEAAWPVRFAWVMLFAGLTGLSAQVAFSLPFTPVPLTAQVLLALVAGGFLGRYLGPASQGVYVALGFLGLPWFAPAPGGSWFSVGGAGVVFGASGGYLLGLIVASALVGWLLDRRVRERRFVPILAVLLAGVSVVYCMGALQFQALFHTSLSETLADAIVPFFPGDMLKAVVGAGLLSMVVSTQFPSKDAPKMPVLRSVSGRDLLAAGGLILAIWALVPLLPALVGSDLMTLRWYYLLAAGVSTFGILLSLGLRFALTREPSVIAEAP